MSYLFAGNEGADLLLTWCVRCDLWPIHALDICKMCNLDEEGSRKSSIYETLNQVKRSSQFSKTLY